MKYSTLLTHFVAAVIITGILLCVYTSVQQVHRSAANDPQIQMARDLSSAISKGKPVGNLMSSDTVDLLQSLAVFAETFNENGMPLQSTGFLNGELPQPPQGIFDFTNENNEDVLTWQPQPNVRMAMVFEKIKSPGKGFIAVGRSLKETEIRESNLIKMIGITWILCMAILIVHYMAQTLYLKRIAK